MTSRIYIVEDKFAQQKHLVKAVNQSQAVRHVAASRFDCAPASALQTAELMTAGVSIQDAAAGPASQKQGDQS